MVIDIGGSQGSKRVTVKVNVFVRAAENGESVSVVTSYVKVYAPGASPPVAYYVSEKV